MEYGVWWSSGVVRSLMMSLMTSGGVESFLYIGTACWYRKIPIVSMPPTQQTLTAAARHDCLYAKYNTDLCAFRYNFNPHGVDNSHHDSSIAYPLAENVFIRIHALDICDDDFADLALFDFLNTFHLSLAHTLARRAEEDIFFTPYNRVLVDCGLQPDLHRPGDGILNMAIGYTVNLGVFAAENSVYHSRTVSLDLHLQSSCSDPIL